MGECNAFAGGHEFRSRQAERLRAELVTLPEFKLYVRRNDFRIGAVIARTGGYMPAVAEQVRAHLGPGGVFVDVGANIGYFTVLAATLVGERGWVVAFEPNPDNCDLIRLSLAANGLTNVAVQQGAVATGRRTARTGDRTALRVAKRSSSTFAPHCIAEGA